MVNVPLLRKTMEYIDEHPLEWRQDNWMTPLSPHLAQIAACYSKADLAREFGVTHQELEQLQETGNWCGSACCFAGWAVELTPEAKPLVADFHLTGFEYDGEDWDIADLAKDLLGLSDSEANVLFCETNTRENLHEIVDRLIAKEEG